MDIQTDKRTFFMTGSFACGSAFESLQLQRNPRAANRSRSFHSDYRRGNVRKSPRLSNSPRTGQSVDNSAAETV